MTYNEYANLFLESSGTSCNIFPLTIRQCSPFWSGIGQVEDRRETMDASGITGTAIKIYTRSTTAREMYYDAAPVRCGDYIYLADRTDGGGTPPNYSDAQYNSHIIEYCISTGEHIDIDLGSNGQGGIYRQGDDMNICIIDERKVMLYDMWLDDREPREEYNYIRIVDFTTNTISLDLAVPYEETTGIFNLPAWNGICVIRDNNDKIHLFVMCYYWNENIGFDGNYDYLPGMAGLTLYHKNYSTDSQWEKFIIPFDTQEQDTFVTNARKFDIVNDRYLVVHCYRIGKGDMQKDYLVEVVYDVEVGETPEMYELVSSWGDGYWESQTLPYSGPDNANNKLYLNLCQQLFENDARDLEFDPITGIFSVGSHALTYPPYYILYYMSTRETSYFWDTSNNNFYLSSDYTQLGNYDIPYEDNDGIVSEFMQVCNLLDTNGGGHPLIWFYDNISNRLRAVDIINGGLTIDIEPANFTNIHWTNIMHMGDCIMLITGAVYPNKTAINYYLVT
jgi:hypothetical protein